VISGGGSFRGARGILFMHDRPVGDHVRTTYKGTLVLAGGASASRVARVPQDGRERLAAAVATGAAC
jgi:hypothetical protein